MSKDSTVLTSQELANLAMLGDYTGKLPEPENKKDNLFTGKQLFSLFLPDDFNYIMTSKWSKGTSGKQKDVVIKNGQLISGVIDKSSIGAEEPESVLHRIAKDYGNAQAKTFLNSELIMIKQFITHYGFSYGYGDLELSDKDRQIIHDDIQKTYDEVYDLIDQEKKGILKGTRGMTTKETLEANIVFNLGKARDKAATTANSSLDDNNAGKIMATTGARGSSLNVGQMAGALGQQARRGNRLNKGYNNRVLAHFAPHDNDPDAHGFVKSNYRINTKDKISISSQLRSANVKRKNTYDKSSKDQIDSMLIYSDDELLVLNKPNGIAVQGGTKIKKHIDGLLQSSFKNIDPRLVHRLDKDTSGVLLVALNRKIADYLSYSFREKKIKKYYWAITYGNFNKKRGMIDNKIKKKNSYSYYSALTEYTNYKNINNKMNFMIYKPITGRNHQIRIHSKELGIPILGDKRYGNNTFKDEKLHLHSRSIEFYHPNGKKMYFEAKLPPHMEEKWKKYKLPYDVNL